MDVEETAAIGDQCPQTQGRNRPILGRMKTYEIHPETRPEQPTAVMEGTMTVSEIGSWLGKVYGEVAIVLARQGAFPAGPPFARYNRMGDGEFDIEAGFPVAQPISGAMR